MKREPSDNSAFFALGDRDVWGGRKPFGISHARLDQHVAVLGASGTGKSTLLRNLIVEMAADGGGLALIDPHGDLATDVLRCFPTARADDLVFLDFADDRFAASFNPLANVATDNRAHVTSSIVSAIRAIWSESWGPRMDRLLHFSVASLLECDNVSLLGIPRLLVDSDYRARILNHVRDPVLVSFWKHEFDRYDPRFRNEIIDPVLNKLAKLALIPALRNTLGQVRNRVEPRYIMDHSRVLIANLSTGRVGEDAARLLGALLVSMFFAAAMSRADLPEASRPRFCLMCDEFSTYATGTLASILAQARKYKLQLTLVTQYLETVDQEIRAAMSGNIGTWFSFRVGHADAQILAKEFGETYPPAAFTDLRNYEVLIKQGMAEMEPFQGVTYPPTGVEHSRAQQLRARCRERYYAPREVVEDRLARWLRR